MSTKLNVEIKKINDDFSVFKYQTEDYIKYGLCFNYELEDLNKGILPEKGIEYGFITKPDMEELTEFHLEERDLDFDLEDFIYDNDKLFANYEILMKENSFKKGYFIKVDAFTEIVEEFYNKLPVIFPIKIENKVHSGKYNLHRAKYLLVNREDIKIDYFFNEEDENYYAIRKGKTEKCIDFWWFPNKKDWKLFKEKLSNSSYKETIKFLIEDILGIPCKNEPPEETRVEIKADLRVQGQTCRINETFGLYQYTYKVNGELFSYSDICLVEEIPDFQKNLILPNKITTKNNDNLEQYVIVKKEYLNRAKSETADVPYRVEDTDYVVEPEYFINLPVDIYFNNYVILKKLKGYLGFPYLDTRTGIPIIHPIQFQHCNCNPVICCNYDLEKVEKYLKNQENIYIVNKSDYFLDFNFYPNEEDWEKLCEYVSQKYELRGAILLQHFLSNKDKEDFMNFILNEIIQLPKGGVKND